MSGPQNSSQNSSQNIVLRDVSKFYGEVLGVNRVDLELEPGITGLVGPNGSGKSTLMNLITGLLRPTRGEVKVLGLTPSEPDLLFRELGYCTQFDSFPSGVNGIQLIDNYLRVHGYPAREAKRLTQRAIDRVGLGAAAERRVAGYSKGMRQRIRLAQAIAHEPRVMVLDEPLNGLDPMARAEIIALFRELADDGLHLLLSSHILHEIDVLSDRVVLINNGYIVAEGDIQGVRDEMQQHPIQVAVRCDRPAWVASLLLHDDSGQHVGNGSPNDVVELRMHRDGGGFEVRTLNADRFFLDFNALVVDQGIEVESIAPSDDDVQAVYQYLVGGEEA